MRDIKRIDRICKKLAELWKCYPDMRFGQLIENYVPIDWNMEDTKEDSYRKDYYTEYFIDREIKEVKLWRRVCSETNYQKDHHKWFKKFNLHWMDEGIYDLEPQWEDYIKELK